MFQRSRPGPGKFRLRSALTALAATNLGKGQAGEPSHPRHSISSSYNYRRQLHEGLFPLPSFCLSHGIARISSCTLFNSLLTHSSLRDRRAQQSAALRKSYINQYPNQRISALLFVRAASSRTHPNPLHIRYGLNTECTHRRFICVLVANARQANRYNGIPLQPLLHLLASC